jgi:hypothetical protein
MKTSMITAVACLMAGAIASPIVDAKAVRTVVDVPVANEARDVQLSDRALLGGTLSGLGSDLSNLLGSLPLVNGLPDLTQLPNLNGLSALVGQIVEVVKTLGTSSPTHPYLPSRKLELTPRTHRGNHCRIQRPGT